MIAPLMKKICFFICLALPVTGFMGAAAAQTAARQAVAIISVDYARLPVTEITFQVEEQLLARPLKAGDVILTENGEKVPALELCYQPDQGVRPVHAAIVVDVSGSMRASMEQVQYDIEKLIEALDIVDSWELFSFGQSYRQYDKFLPAEEALTLAARLKAGEAFTSLYDGVYFTLRRLSDLPGSKLLLLFSDGIDNNSTLRAADIITYAGNRDIKIFAFGYGEYVNLQALEELAVLTGGEFWYLPASEELLRMADLARLQLAHVYRVSFSSSVPPQESSRLELTLVPEVLVQKEQITAGAVAERAAIQEEAPEIPEPENEKSTFYALIILAAGILLLLLVRFWRATPRTITAGHARESMPPQIPAAAISVKRHTVDSEEGGPVIDLVQGEQGGPAELESLVAITETAATTEEILPAGEEAPPGRPEKPAKKALPRPLKQLSLNFALRPKTAEVKSEEEAQAYGSLEVVEGEDLGRSIPLSATDYVIGKGEDATIQLNDYSVSLHHARLSLRNGTFILKDLASVNGTFVRGRKIKEIALADGDRIRVGNTTLLFRRHNG